jgi:exonuclease SbcC
MHVRERLESLVEDAETKKGVIESLENRLRSLEAQAGSDRVKLMEIGLEDLQLDALGQNTRGFDDRLSSLRGEREAANEGVRSDEKRVSSLVRENLCPLCLQALTDDYKARLVERIREENDKRLARVGQLTVEIDEVQRKRDLGSVALSDLAVLMPRIDDLKVRITEENERLEVLSGDLVSKQEAERDQSGQLVAVRKELEVFDSGRLEVARKVREEAFREFHVLESDLRFKESRRSDLRGRLDDLKDRIDVAQGKIERVRKILKAFDVIGAMRDAYRGIQPKLRSEFVKVLRVFVQRVLDDIVGSEGSELNVVIDDTYTPFVVSEGGLEREVSNLSGGERTLLAFAYRLGLGQLIMQSRTGHGLSLLLLDEPTESLGREDGSIDRLAEAVSRFKAVEQTIAVTHSEVFAEKADHVIRLEKEAGVSKVTVEK